MLKLLHDLCGCVLHTLAEVSIFGGTRNESDVLGPLCADFDGFSSHDTVRVVACELSARMGGNDLAVRRGDIKDDRGSPVVGLTAQVLQEL